MKRSVKFISFLLSALMIISVIVPFSVEAKNDQYVNELIAKGFPEDYAVKLSALHDKHPNWSFEPLKVTEMSNGKYTWDYVIYMETDDNPKRSLVYNSEMYKKWRHPSNQQYDSGWWRASVETVKYFMDPRNFMNDEQIFQFYDLAWSDTVTLSSSYFCRLARSCSLMRCWRRRMSHAPAPPSNNNATTMITAVHIMRLRAVSTSWFSRFSQSFSNSALKRARLSADALL